MSHGGKGSAPRKERQDDKFRENWERIFGDKRESVFARTKASALTRFAHVEERKMTLIDLDAIAAMIGVPRRQVRDVVVKRHDFPKPALALSQKTRRWLLVDVERWITTH